MIPIPLAMKQTKHTQKKKRLVEKKRKKAARTSKTISTLGYLYLWRYSPPRSTSSSANLSIHPFIHSLNSLSPLRPPPLLHLGRRFRLVRPRQPPRAAAPAPARQQGAAAALLGGRNRDEPGTEHAAAAAAAASAALVVLSLPAVARLASALCAARLGGGAGAGVAEGGGRR